MKIFNALSLLLLCASSFLNAMDEKEVLALIEKVKRQSTESRQRTDEMFPDIKIWRDLPQTHYLKQRAPFAEELGKELEASRYDRAAQTLKKRISLEDPQDYFMGLLQFLRPPCYYGYICEWKLLQELRRISPADRQPDIDRALALVQNSTYNRMLEGSEVRAFRKKMVAKENRLRAEVGLSIITPNEKLEEGLFHENT